MAVQTGGETNPADSGAGALAFGILQSDPFLKTRPKKLHHNLVFEQELS